jgi:chromosome segregation ATPase
MAESWEARADRLDGRIAALAALIAPLAQSLSQHEVRMAAYDDLLERQQRTNERLEATLTAIKDLLERGNGGRRP